MNHEDSRPALEAESRELAEAISAAIRESQRGVRPEPLAAGDTHKIVSLAGSAGRMGQLTNAALMLTARYDRYERTADLSEATAAAHDAAAIAGPPPMRVNASLLAVDLLGRAGHWQQAAAAYGTAVGRLSEAAWIGADRASRLHQMGRWPGLAGLATAAAIRAGDLGGAVVANEEGRSVLWSQTLSLRADLDRLSREHPAQAARLDEVRAVLDPGVSSDSRL